MQARMIRPLRIISSPGIPGTAGSAAAKSCAAIGFLVLEALDFVVDPKANRLIPNPEHDGKWIADLL